MAKLQPPPATGNDGFDRWLRLFVNAALVPTDNEVATGADHTLLQNLNSTNYTHLTSSQAQELTSNASTVLHFHAADRDRANHTGTQTSDTISDFASAVQAFAGTGTGALSGTIATNSAATYTVQSNDYTVIQETVASVYTLPSAASSFKRLLRLVKQITGTVTSASSNVVPISGGAASTAILPSGSGAWADLQSNGVNWLITASGIFTIISSFTFLLQEDGVSFVLLEDGVSKILGE